MNCPTNRRRLIRSDACVVSMMALCLSFAAQFSWSGALKAADLTWDSNGSASPNPQDGGGTGANGWNTTDLKWWDGVSHFSWDNAAGNTAIFGGGAEGTAGNVAVQTGGVSAGGLSFVIPFSGSYTLSGGAITLTGASPAISVGAGVTATISSVLNGGTLVKSGAGRLNLAGANAFSNLSISGGVVAFSLDNQLGAVPAAPTAGSLTFSNGGELLFTGSTTRVDINRGIAIGTGGGTIRHSGSSTLWIDGKIEDVATQSGVLTLTGTGNQTLAINNGTSTYSGGTILSGNTVVVPVQSSTLSGGVITQGPFGTGLLTFAGARFRATSDRPITIHNQLSIIADTVFTANSGGRSLEFAGNGTLGGSRLITVEGNAVVSFTGNLGEDAVGTRLIKAGTGTLHLGGANSFSGGVTINGGVVEITQEGGTGGAASSLGAVPSTATADNIVLNGGTLRIVSPGALNLHANRGISIGAGGGTITNARTSTSGTIFIYGTITDAPGASAVLTYNASGAGAGKLTAIDNANSTYSGGTILSSGLTVVPVKSSTLEGDVITKGPFGTGTITFAGASFRATGGQAIILHNALIFNANTSVVSGGNKLTFAGNATLTGDRVFSSASVNEVVFSGAIGDGGNNFGFTKSGTGTVVFSGSNTYTGTTSITAGTLRTDAVNSISSSSEVNLSDTATAALSLNNFSQNIGALSGGGSTGGNVTLGNATLTTGTKGINTSYSGVISGTGGFAKVGTGTQVLNGGNSYTGATTVTGGILQVGHGGGAGTRAAGRTGSGAAGNVLHAHTGGTVAGTGTIAGTTTHLVSSGGTIAPGDVTGSGADPTGLGTLSVEGGLNASSGTILLQIGGASYQDATLAGLAPEGNPGYATAVNGLMSTNNWEASATGSQRGNHDLLDISGQLSLNGDSRVMVSLAGYNPVAGDVFDLLDWVGALGGMNFNVGTNFRAGGNGNGNLYLPDLVDGSVWDVSKFTETGMIFVVVPEPGRGLLLLVAALGCLLRRRR